MFPKHFSLLTQSFSLCFIIVHYHMSLLLKEERFLGPTTFFPKNIFRGTSFWFFDENYFHNTQHIQFLRNRYSIVRLFGLHIRCIVPYISKYEKHFRSPLWTQNPVLTWIMTTSRTPIIHIWYIRTGQLYVLYINVGRIFFLFLIM